MTITYAIADIHGCLAQLERLVEVCCEDAPNDGFCFVFLGDYIDRGEHSCGVIDFLIRLQKWKPHDVTCLMGNHEAMLLSAFDDVGTEQHWRSNGGTETLRSYGVSSAFEIPSAHRAWLASLPSFHNDGLRLFVHAGVNPAVPLDAQDQHDLLWIREPFLSSSQDYGRLIVHGHTLTSNRAPDLRGNRLNLDTGAVYGGPLVAAIFEDTATLPVGFLLDS